MSYKGKANNIGSCVENRAHKSVWPEPMYIRNDIGHADYRALGEPIKQQHVKCTLHVEDVSNRSGMRAKGGY